MDFITAALLCNKMYSLDLCAGRFAASNEMDSVMAYEFKTDSGFHMIHADRHSRPISHCAALQNPTPSQATIAAVDQKGRALFMAPEPETYGPERNMYTAVQYHLGQAPAGIVEGNLRQHPRDDENNAEPSQTASSSSAISHDHDRFGLSLSALPEFGRDVPREGRGAEEPGVGFTVGSAVHPPQTTGRPQGVKPHSKLACCTFVLVFCKCGQSQKHCAKLSSWHPVSRTFTMSTQQQKGPSLMCCPTNT